MAEERAEREQSVSVLRQKPQRVLSRGVKKDHRFIHAAKHFWCLPGVPRQPQFWPPMVSPAGGQGVSKGTGEPRGGVPSSAWSVTKCLLKEAVLKPGPRR